MKHLNQLAVAPELGAEDDERRLLVRRVVSSPPFQKAERLRALLIFIVEQTLLGNTAELTEQRIGHAVFGKPADYSPVEDSSVRANARQLRLRLHEYFHTVGRDEPLILELPKGTFVPEFHRIPAAPVPESPRRTPAGRLRLAAGAAALAIVSATAGYLAGFPRHPEAAPPWPFSEIYDQSNRTKIVVSDSFCFWASAARGRPLTVQEYLAAAHSSSLPDAPEPERRLLGQLLRTHPVPLADVVAADQVAAALDARGRVSIISAHDFALRDFREGNVVLIGTPDSNPWISLCESRLNFREERGEIVNRDPRPGEPDRYTGTVGTGYAVVALLPHDTGHGNFLILQAANSESADALVHFLDVDSGREALLRALRGTADEARRGLFFEAVIRVGAAKTEIVAARRAAAP